MLETDIQMNLLLAVCETMLTQLETMACAMRSVGIPVSKDMETQITQIRTRNEFARSIMSITDPVERKDAFMRFMHGSPQLNQRSVDAFDVTPASFIRQ